VNFKGDIEGLGECIQRPICMCYGADELRESQEACSIALHPVICSCTSRSYKCRALNKSSLAGKKKRYYTGAEEWKTTWDFKCKWGQREALLRERDDEWGSAAGANPPRIALMVASLLPTNLDSKVHVINERGKTGFKIR
jgi:hypothetical protein